MNELFYTIFGMVLALFSWGFYQMKRAEKAEQKSSERKVDEIIEASKKKVAGLDSDGRAALGNDLLREYRKHSDNPKK